LISLIFVHESSNLGKYFMALLPWGALGGAKKHPLKHKQALVSQLRMGVGKAGVFKTLQETS